MNRLPTYAELRELALLFDEYARDEGARADALAKIEGANPSPRRVKRRRLERGAEILHWLSGRADRLYLLTEPVRRPSNYGGGR